MSCFDDCVSAEARAGALADAAMVRAEIPLVVVPAQGPAETRRTADLTLLLRVLLQEEQQELRAAVTDALDR